MADGETQLESFLGAAGRSLNEAQRQLTGSAQSLGEPTAMAITEVDLEVKVTFESSERDEVTLRPITISEVRSEEVKAEVVSTLRVRYIAVPEEEPSNSLELSARSEEDVIQEVRQREDVSSLEHILGGLEFNAVFVPATRSWVVKATDRRHRVVREVTVPDAEH